MAVFSRIISCGDLGFDFNRNILFFSEKMFDKTYRNNYNLSHIDSCITELTLGWQMLISLRIGRVVTES